MVSEHLDFGLFFPPVHAVGQNPTLALQRDLELIEHADAWGYTEAWVGEHHSGGAEFIGPSEIFVAAAIERTRRIRIGTGVVTLPYHHPFHVAERAIFLDHLSRGRTMLGVGPGSLPTDAAMIGVPWAETRSRMTEAWEAIHHLVTSDEPLTMKTDWFTLDNAMMQLRPYSRPHMEFAFTGMESPFGPSLAGQYGGTLISIGATTAPGFAALGRHWTVVEEAAAAHDKVADRANWAVVCMIHAAETEAQAKAEIQSGMRRFADYSSLVAERPSPLPLHEMSVGEVVDIFHSGGTNLFGTPDQIIEMIQGIQEITGGFGRVLVQVGNDLANREATLRSLELIAREVAPVFQGSTERQQMIVDLGSANRDERVAAQRASIDAAQRSGRP